MELVHDMTAPGAQETAAVVATFERMLEVAAAHEVIGQRLALAATTVRVDITDAARTVTLLLDREPVEAVAGETGETEVTLEVTTRDVVRFWAGELHLAMAILHGDIAFSGPVRKLLRIVPVARRLVPDFLELAAADPALGAAVRRHAGAALVPTEETV